MSRIVISAAPAGTRNFKTLLWSKVQITKSLDEICHSLVLELPVNQRSLIAVHDTVEVRFYNKYITHNNGNLRVTTVRIDEIIDMTDNGQKHITVLGRSPARDIIDSTWSQTIAGQADLFVRRV